MKDIEDQNVQIQDQYLTSKQKNSAILDEIRVSLLTPLKKIQSFKKKTKKEKKEKKEKKKLPKEEEK